MAGVEGTSRGSGSFGLSRSFDELEVVSRPRDQFIAHLDGHQLAAFRKTGGKTGVGTCVLYFLHIEFPLVKSSVRVTGPRPFSEVNPVANLEDG